MASIRVNTLRTTRQELMENLSKICEVRGAGFYEDALILDCERPAKTLYYSLGHYAVQSLTSMLPVLALDPQENEAILDICAAPGSKTTQIAAKMKDRGVVIANDDSFMRLKALANQTDRFGITNCAITNYDGRKFPSGVLFDRVLVDAPCSGLGSRFRHMELSENRLRQLAKVQKKILVRAFDLLKPGGRLVYSTCTTSKAENEEVVSYLLDKREESRLEKPKLVVGGDFDIGLRVCLDETFFIAQIEKR